MKRIFDILRDFHLAKNVEEGFTQEDWVNFVDNMEYWAKRELMNELNNIWGKGIYCKSNKTLEGEE